MEIKNESLHSEASAISRKLGGLILLSATEVEFLESIQNNRVRIEKGDTFVQEGSEFLATFIIRSGWVARERNIGDGRRQIISLALPGDFIGLHVNFKRQAAYDAKAMTDVEAALIEPSRVLEIHQQYPVLASGLSWSTVREYNILGEQAVRLGRKSATERLSHLILELYHRLDLVGLAGPESITFPLTQDDVADALGLSSVHANRTFKELKKRGLIEYSRDDIELIDIEKLKSLAGFNPAFLSGFDNEPQPVVKVG